MINAWYRLGVPPGTSWESIRDMPRPPDLSEKLFTRALRVLQRNQAFLEHYVLCAMHGCVAYDRACKDARYKTLPLAWYLKQPRDDREAGCILADAFATALPPPEV